MVCLKAVVPVFSCLGLVLAVEIASNTSPAAQPRAHKEAGFVHPGLLQSSSDLERISIMVAQGVEPWGSGFERLKEDAQSRADWRVRGPFPVVVRDPRASLHIAELEADSNAAYQNALMWCITTNEAYAKTAVRILNAWSGTLREISGHDKELGSSLCGFKLVSAAELMRYTYSGWEQADIQRCEKMFREVFYPVIKDFATFANGNWDSGCVKAMMGIGVFLDDRDMFDRAVEYFRHGAGNGALAHYIINDGGQCQESGRDQQHAQLGLGHLAECCEVAWHQGLDLYHEANNRLLLGFEYTAKFNLGLDVPFAPYKDLTGKNKARVISQEGRGRLRPIYEMVFNHYERRRGIAAPFTKQAAERIRPEGRAWSADHPGFGTLLFSLPNEGSGPSKKDERL